MGAAYRRNCGRARPRHALFVAAGTLLAGCQSVQPPAAPPPTAPAVVTAPAAPQPAESELLQFIARAAPGSSAVLPDPRRGQIRVLAGRQYFSAAGLSCRHFTVFPAGGDGEIGAACREPDGWRLDPITSKGAALLNR